jgi:hypothetical protein
LRARISQRLLYRVYVIIDLREDRVVLLQNEALRVWKSITEGGHDLDRHNGSVLERLAGLGLI